MYPHNVIAIVSWEYGRTDNRLTPLPIELLFKVGGLV